MGVADALPGNTEVTRHFHRPASPVDGRHDQRHERPLLYSAKFTLKDTALYQWADGTTAPKNCLVEDRQADGSLTLSKTAITLEDGRSPIGFFHRDAALGTEYDLCFVQPSEIATTSLFPETS